MTGGDIHEAYDIIKICQNYTEKDVSVFVPVRAMSVATLICLGSDNIYLSDIGKIGPLDPQVFHPNYGKEGCYIPVRAITDIPDVLEKALETNEESNVSEKIKGDAIIKPIAEQVDPYILTCHQETSNLAKEYGRKLIQRKGASEKKIDQLLDFLINYPVHSYGVDYREINSDSKFNVLDADKIKNLRGGEKLEEIVTFMVNIFTKSEDECPSICSLLLLEKEHYEQKEIDQEKQN